MAGYSAASGSRPPTGQPHVEKTADKPISSPLFCLEATVDGVVFQLPCATCRPASLRVGRDIGPADLWEKMVPCEASRHTISREHFEIREVQQDSSPGFLLNNLSTHGTFLNGQPVRNECPIEPGDALMIGVDQSPAGVLAAKQANLPQRAALQMFFIIPLTSQLGGSIASFSASLECIHAVGRSLQELSILPGPARCLIGSGNAGPKSALLRIGRAMQVPMWWETLVQKTELVNDISREHFQIRDEDGKAVLINLSQAGTYVNGERAEGKTYLCQNDIVSILKRSDKQAIVSFRFRAIDAATGRASHENQAAFEKISAAAAQSLAEAQKLGAAGIPASAEQSQIPACADSQVASSGMSGTRMRSQSGSRATPACPPAIQDPVLEATYVFSQDASVVGTAVLGGITEPSSFWLQCISAHGQDSKDILQESHLRAASGSASLKVGRSVQPARFWTTLVPSEVVLNSISRECFEISRTIVDGLPRFLLRNLSSAGTLVNGERAHDDMTLQSGDTLGIGAVQPAPGQNLYKAAVELRLVVIATAQNVAPPCATGIGGIAGTHNSGYRQEISAEDSSEHSAWKHLQRPCPEEGTVMQTNCQAWPMQEDELEVSLIVNRAVPRGDKLDENHARSSVTYHDRHQEQSPAYVSTIPNELLHPFAGDSLSPSLSQLPMVMNGVTHRDSADLEPSVREIENSLSPSLSQLPMVNDGVTHRHSADLEPSVREIELLHSFGDVMPKDTHYARKHDFELKLSFDPPAQAVMATSGLTPRSSRSGSSTYAREPLDTAAYSKNTVFVNIYDIGRDNFGKMINQMTTMNDAVMVGGVFHAGIEVYGYEWSFGRTEDESTGVWRTLPRMEIGHSYRETLPLGPTKLSSEQVLELLHRLADEWPGADYDLLRRNCLNFCNVLCGELGVQSIPHWVDRAPRAATAVLGATNIFGCTGRAK